MEELKNIITRQHRERPIGEDPLVEHLLEELLSLAEEVCVLQDRLDTCEQLASDGKLADAAAIDAYERDAVAVDRRRQTHEAFFTALFGRISRSQ